jgi:serine/threonine-protein kinase
LKLDQWKEISDLYLAALELPESKREAFLQKCIASDEIRHEVASLLANEGAGEVLLQSPALEVAARMLAKENHSDPSRSSIPMIGKTVSHYRIVDKIGQGGMGEVYQAKDLTLGRDVAIKVLPDEFARDADRVPRFEREAKLLASLNHPNIAAIYGLEQAEGKRFIVMELVEGETLAQRLSKGPLPVEEALGICREIAEGLEAAHEKGVIHRDLKPANIKVTPDGKVKVLDFGLAKAFAGEQSELNLSNSPTLSNAATQQGIILGTAAYMSPEQARGKPVDKRADIWAFGCVLFEMLTGHAAFSGKDVTDILAAVIRAEPEWANLPASLHWRLREILERCLEKEAKDRYHDISDVKSDIQRVLTDPSGVMVQPITTVEPRARLRTILPWVVVILGIIIAVVAVWKPKPTEPRQVMRSEYIVPEDQQLGSQAPTLAVSPDGKQFVYSTPKGLYVRSLDEFDAKLIIGTETNPVNPFFSPDGKWVGYYSLADNKLKKIAISGGAPVTLCDTSVVSGASWGTDDRIVYGNSLKDIDFVSANGGTPEVILKEAMSGNPQLLPDGKSVLFTSWTEPHTIVVQSLQSGERKELFAGHAARYISTGHIIYGVGNNLLAVPFDLNTLKVTGGPVTVVEGVWRAGYGYVPQYAVSDSGTLVYMPSRAAPVQLVWLDRKGKQVPIGVAQKISGQPSISPDGTKLALTIYSGNKPDIWIVDLLREAMTRLTFNESSRFPLWTRDGKRIIFRSGYLNQFKSAVYWKAADGTGSDDELIPVQNMMELIPSSWSSDGKTLLLMKIAASAVSGAELQCTIESLPLEGDRKLRPLLKEKYLRAFPYPEISPDGRWMAYQSSESGKLEIHVRPFPEVNKGKWQVSTSGGSLPLWSPNGKELFYRNGDTVTAVAVEAGMALKCGKPETLFQGKYSSWDIHPDGKRFLMMKEVGSKPGAAEGPRKINIVLNWTEELKRRVPAK